MSSPDLSYSPCSIAAVGFGWARSPDKLPGVKMGLGKNALNLFVLGIFFWNRSSAFAAILSALKVSPDKKSAIKRAVSLCLPLSYLRKYFWNPDQLKGIDLPKEALAKLASTQPPLIL